MGLAIALPFSLIVPSSSEANSEPASIKAYEASILPLLEKHCYECHGDGYDKGKVAFDRLETPDQILAPDLWVKVLLNTRAGLMPAEQKLASALTLGWLHGREYRRTFCSYTIGFLF